MKELDQFTVERLTKLSTSENLPELAALARIALAVKAAEPVAWLTWHQGYRAPDDCEEYLNAYTHETKEKSCNGDAAFRVYDAPILNSPVIPDSWVACSDRMPADCQTVLYNNLLTELSGIPLIADYVAGSGTHDSTECETGFYVGREIVQPAVTHWHPLPSPPTTEK